MSLNIDIECENVEVYTTRGDMWVNVTGAKLSDNISAGEIVSEYGASTILDAIGGFEDWLEEGGIKADEVAEWLADQGYSVERN